MHLRGISASPNSWLLTSADWHLRAPLEISTWMGRRLIPYCSRSSLWSFRKSVEKWGSLSRKFVRPYGEAWGGTDRRNSSAVSCEKVTATAPRFVEGERVRRLYGRGGKTTSGNRRPVRFPRLSARGVGPALLALLPQKYPNAPFGKKPFQATELLPIVKKLGYFGGSSLTDSCVVAGKRYSQEEPYNISIYPKLFVRSTVCRW